MAKTKFNLISKIWSLIILCSIILAGCDTFDWNSATEQTADIANRIKPRKIDMTGVKGYVIIENNFNSVKTRGNANDSIMGDNIQNSDTTVSYSHSLYTIDENGELHISIFYFEVTPSEDGNTDSLETKIMKEISNALQVVPSLVTDFGKYILFSGCQYKINNIAISDEARAICETYIQNNYKDDMTYMIRKSDGALFDLSYQPQSIFTYAFIEPLYSYGVFTGTYHYIFESRYNSDLNAFGWHIPSYRYMTSPKGNLFVQSCQNDHISKIVDNGDAIDIRLLTQDYLTHDLTRFIVDASENIYLYNNERNYLDVYYFNGEFDAIDMRSQNDSDIFDNFPIIFDMKIDDNNIPYLFLVGQYMDSGDAFNEGYIKAGVLSEGKYIERNRIPITSYNWGPYFGFLSNQITYPHYIGYSNGDFKWFLSQEFWNIQTFKILTYNKDRDEWILKELPEDLCNIFIKKYDSLLCGVKSYGVNIKDNTIEITEIDIENENYHQYSFNIDVSFIKSQHYITIMMNESPYLIINGKNSENGADVSFKINLVNGENNSTFASDNRNVVSFFRIN